MGLVIGAAPILAAVSGPVFFDTYVEMGDGVLYRLELVAHPMQYGQGGEVDVV